MDNQYLDPGDDGSSIVCKSIAQALENNEELLRRLDTEPSPFAKLVLPTFKFFRLIGFCPSWYTFDGDSQTFARTQSCSVVKVICYCQHGFFSRFYEHFLWFQTFSILIGTLVAIHTYGLFKLGELQVKNNTILVMTKILGACSTLYVITLFHALLVKGEDFREILNFLQHASREMCKAGCILPSRIKVTLAFLKNKNIT